MKCKFCQSELLDNSRYCEHCGRILETDILAKPKKPVKKRGYIIAGIIVVAVIFIATMFGGNFQSTLNNADHGQSSPYDLGFTQARFKNNFNDHSYAKSVHLAIGEMQKNKNGDMQYSFSNNLVLIEKIDGNSNKIRELLVIGQPTDKEEQVKLIASMGVIIDLFNEDSSVEDRKAILQELGFDEQTDLKTVNNETTRGSIKYSFQNIKELGFVFNVSKLNLEQK